MTSKYSTLLLYTILLGAPLARAPICNADEFHSDSYGYRIELPHDWVEIPQDVVQAALALVQKPNSTVSIIYDAGFQLDSGGQWFEYPYVLVQPLPYSEYGLYRQINEDEFPKFVRMITGMDVGKLVGEELSSLGRQIVANLGAGQPQLDVADRRFLWTMNMDVQGVGPIRALTVGYFGRDSIVQVVFYSLRDDWDRYADVRATIVDSFRFDLAKAYSVQVAASNPSPPSIWSRAMGKAITGGIAGGIIALIFGGVAVAKRKKTGVTQLTEQWKDVQRQLGVIALSEEPPYAPELVEPLRTQLDTIEKKLGKKATEKLHEEAEVGVIR